MGVIAAVPIRHRQPIVEEAEMELARLERATDTAIIFGGGEIGSGFWMSPRANKVRTVLGLEEAHEFHLAHLRNPAKDAQIHAI